MDDTEEDVSWAPWTGLVAFIDILGGRGLYLSGDQSDKRKLEKYSKFVETLNPSNREDRAVLCFSDCIYFVQEAKVEEGMSPDIFPSQAIDFLETLSKFMTLCMASQIPVRGGIAYGDVEVLRPNLYNMVKGASVVQAYELELAQNWSGIALIPVSYVSENYQEYYSHILETAEKNWNRKLISKYAVPVSSGVMELHVLCWHPDCVATAHDRAQGILEGLLEERQDITNLEKLQEKDKIISKYPITLNFMNLCRTEFIGDE